MTHLLCLETFSRHLKFKTKFCGLEQSLSAQHVSYWWTCQRVRLEEVKNCIPVSPTSDTNSTGFEWMLLIFGSCSMRIQKENSEHPNSWAGHLRLVEKCITLGQTRRPQYLLSLLQTEHYIISVWPPLNLLDHLLVRLQLGSTMFLYKNKKHGLWCTAFRHAYLTIRHKVCNSARCFVTLS